MADLGHIELVVLDTTGVAVDGATCVIRPQGTYASAARSIGDSTLFVREPNAIVAGSHTVGFDTDADGPYSVTAITSHTSLSIGSTLTANHTAYQRITIRSAVANFCFKDQFGSSAVDTTNTVTTNANGYASCYAKVGLYDVLVSGGTPAITSRLLADVPASGPGYNISNIYTVGNAGSAYIFDTLRNLTEAGDRLVSFRTNSGATELLYLTYNGTSWRTISNCNLIIGGALYVDSSGVDGTPGAAGSIIAETFIQAGTQVRVGPSSDTGTSGKLTLTNTTTTAVSTGTATIKTTTTSNINSTGFLTFYDGTTTRYIPFFNATG